MHQAHSQRIADRALSERFRRAEIRRKADCREFCGNVPVLEQGGMGFLQGNGGIVDGRVLL